MFSAVLRDGHLSADDVPALPWWSFTKTLIAALTVRSAARGQLDLDAPCKGHAWTLRDLLQHRAGLGDYGPMPRYKAAVAAGEAPWTDAEFLRAVPLDALMSPPRESFRYSNIGYLLVVQALEAATGHSLETLLREMTAPLGLSSVHIARMPSDFADLPFPSGGYHPGWVAHRCAMGTPADAVRLLRAILDDPTLGEMQAAVPLGGTIAGRPWTETGYGLGMMIGRVGTAGRAIGHSGGGAFSANAVYALPDCPGNPVVATFVAGGDEAPAETAAVALACAG
ncbi:serine hydrolase domain-containing protein [Jannaschia marina]|uniref:serine hydrolase domain-containing protein n=1 Tax=Jannaschia marina TaxID=2741674 RepID=UPI001F29DDF8|nr:serine hydrolase domain-containing protein [Jannaschia marina]